jgi:hypothetical protein
MKNPHYTLIVYRDSSKEKDFMNMYDLKVFQTLEEAKEQLSDTDYDGMAWDIKECYEWKITDLNKSEEDDIVEDNVIYRPLADIENWPVYDWPCKTLGEAKRRALNCIEKEHCGVYIEKSKSVVILSGTSNF